jgi:hypothetical protein
MAQWKRSSFNILPLLLGLAGCEFTGADDPQDGPCGKHCEGELAYCHLEIKACVACTDDAHCTDEDTPFCDELTGRCGACATSTDCPHADRARCNAETLMCEFPCQEHSDCEGIDGKEACSPQGLCVQCTPDNETACDGKVCEPDTLRCSSTIEQATTENCHTCITDTQCIEDHKCIPLEYQDSHHGNYCMRLGSATCAEPYQVNISRKSVLAAENDEPEEYCGINESLVTCEGVVAFNADCANGTDEECGADGAICREVNNAPNRCTYYCSSTSQCEDTFICPGSGGGTPQDEDRFCGK